ncbi:MAG: KpsF/GutQ family sugar-phosphate isomerase [Bacteroidota bacterium]
MEQYQLIVDTARTTIEIEADTLYQLTRSIDARFVAATQCVFGCSGRVVITGIGKSALIGQKIVATLNSTGTPALFMHAADAIHGDLGMVTAQDVVLCISKSGETAEIKILVPLLKKRDIPIIGMVSHQLSYLAVQSDFVLHTPITEEADPNKLAPTASTTAQLAMGDALATALLAMRGFKSSDFAQFHPGGALGKQLYLRVSDIYPRHECPTVAPSDSIATIILEITSKRLGATVVVDEQQRVMGIITDGDLRRMLERYGTTATLTARDIMGRHPKTVPTELLAIEALDIMRTNSITQLVVVQAERCVGVIHLHDLLQEGLI